MQLSTCGFTQIANGIDNVVVGREGAMLYDAIHGSMLYVAEDSLPDGIDEVTITMKRGFNACKLDILKKQMMVIGHYLQLVKI